MDEAILKKAFSVMDRQQLEELAVQLWHMNDVYHKKLMAEYDLKPVKVEGDRCK